MLFGGASVVGKFGVHGTNPVLFALIREGSAGPILVLIAYILSKEKPNMSIFWRLLACGFMIYLN